MSQIEQIDRIEAMRRAETIRSGMVGYAMAMQAIGEAFEARDWVALGHKDWDTYCEKEFSEKRLKLTRDQREQAVLAFRGAGMSTRAIASALGVDDKTVRNDLRGADFSAPEEVRGADGKTYSPTAPKSTPVDPPVPSDTEQATTRAGESDRLEEDRPASAEPGEAEDGGPSSAADGVAKAPAAPREQSRTGVSGSAPAPASHQATADEELTDDERVLFDQLIAGKTVVVTLRGAHDRLIRRAEAAGMYQRIDRKTEWGNPFELGADGDRDTVIVNFAAHYLPHKPSLLKKLPTLKGKALGCWCSPEPCHGEILASQADA